MAYSKTKGVSNRMAKANGFRARVFMSEKQRIDELKAALQQAYDALVRYEMDVDADAPPEHRRMMLRLRDVLAACACECHHHQCPSRPFGVYTHGLGRSEHQPGCPER